MGISVNPISNRIYVTNVGDNTVSVIDGSKDQILCNNNNNNNNSISVNPFLKPPFNDYDPSAKIHVNVQFPLVASFAAVNPATNMVYATNTASNVVSVIDGNKDAVLVKLNFNINPSNAGEIVCNGVRSVGTNSDIILKGRNTTVYRKCSPWLWF